MMISVEQYRSVMAPEWNEFIARSRNGTFLLDRRYMDYHSARFTDHSLLLRDGDGRLLGLLPANVQDDALASHGGLTYAGLVVAPKTGVLQVLGMLAAVRASLRDAGLRRLLYKTIPAIYHRAPSEDDRYALHVEGAALTRRDVLSVVARGDRPAYQERRARGIKSARKDGVVIAEDPAALAGFWEILAETLATRHTAAPVHSLQEILLLQARFPEAIRLFTARHGGAVVAGAVVYETDRVAHVQYIAANDAGRRLRALDLLFHVLLAEIYVDKPWFDFGISNERSGELNNGLVEQKEGFGARVVVHDHYELTA